MEFTNIVFSAFFIFLLMSGMVVFMADVNQNYPLSANNSLNSSLQNISESVNRLNTAINESTIQSTTFTSTDNALTAAFGYLFGAFSAIKVMVIDFPTAYMNIIFVLAGFGSPYVPSYLVNTVIIGVNLLVLIGILYYLLKVK